MSREKHVYKTDEIPHLWANRSKDDARNPQGNLYFSMDVLYSYRDSYPVGIHVTNNKGKTAVLINSNTYSHTTSEHISSARSAIHHLPNIFTIPLCDYRPDLHGESEAEKCFKEHYQIEIGELLAKAKRAREHKPYLVRKADALKTEANNFARFFGLSSRVKDDKGMSQLRIEAEERHKANLKTIQKRREAKAIAQAEADKQRQENLQLWLNGENISTYQLPNNWNEPTHLRIKNDNVETTMGANVPIGHALRVCRFVKRIKEAGQDWQSNGHTLHVGLYKVDYISANGDLRAGCHNIAWSEIERILNLLEAGQVIEAE